MKTPLSTGRQSLQRRSTRTRNYLGDKFSNCNPALRFSPRFPQPRRAWTASIPSRRRRGRRRHRRRTAIRRRAAILAGSAEALTAAQNSGEPWSAERAVEVAGQFEAAMTGVMRYVASRGGRRGRLAAVRAAGEAAIYAADAEMSGEPLKRMPPGARRPNSRPCGASQRIRTISGPLAGAMGMLARWWTTIFIPTAWRIRTGGARSYRNLPADRRGGARRQG